MLFAVRRSFFHAFLICAVLGSALLARGLSSHPSHSGMQQSQEQAPPQNGQQETPPQQQAAPPAPTPGQQPTPSQIPTPAPVRMGPVVVIDPGHGGTDSGARGAGGALEKDAVLLFARVLRAELERLGYRVVMTRNDDSNPSYDDRAALANAYRDPVFVSLHVSSTGTFGTARVYFYQFPAPWQPAGSATPSSAPPSPGSATLWDEAQRAYADPSRRLANLMQIELAHRFPASPNAPAPVAVRSLRSVASPAVAIELSSVSVADPGALTALAAPLASSVGRGVAAFHPIAVPAAPSPIPNPNPSPTGQP